MDYQDAMGYLEGLEFFGMKLGLERIEHLLKELGNPEKKLFLAADGSVTGQCFLNEDKSTLNTRAVVQGGVVTEVLIDTTGNGVADTREVYSGEAITRVDVDTNGDRKPDIVQSSGPGGVARQDEDSDFDGVIDNRFDGDQLVDIPAGTKIQGAAFGPLGCASFHRFWWKR